MKDFIKANLKVLPMTLLFCAASVYAATGINSSNVVYNDNGRVSDVETALNTLYDSIDVATITPVGAVLPYMGTSAPENYLICDGSTYNIADYQKLADHIKNNFGSYNKFGGDGETTFAVPDLRGEFLRGSGTNSHTNQGSGANVAEHQDATSIPYFYSNTRYIYTYKTGGVTSATNMDSTLGGASSISGYTFSANEGAKDFSSYTSRPTNTSVNYIIKAK